MTPPEDLQAAIQAAAPAGLPVRAVRFNDPIEATGPSIVWRLADGASQELLDGGLGAAAIEIECRSPGYQGAIEIARTIIESFAISGQLNRILVERDEPDDPSQERGRYFARLLVVEIVA